MFSLIIFSVIKVCFYTSTKKCLSPAKRTKRTRRAKKAKKAPYLRNSTMKVQFPSELVKTNTLYFSLSSILNFFFRLPHFIICGKQNVPVAPRAPANTRSSFGSFCSPNLNNHDIINKMNINQ